MAFHHDEMPAAVDMRVARTGHQQAHGAGEAVVNVNVGLTAGRIALEHDEVAVEADRGAFKCAICAGAIGNERADVC